MYHLLLVLLVTTSGVSCQINALASVLEFAGSDSNDETARNMQDKSSVLERPAQSELTINNVTRISLAS